MSFNINKLYHDDGRQHRRQSKDFQDIWNIQTDVNIDQLKWDKAFHNYENPEKCEGRKRPEGCLICQKLES